MNSLHDIESDPLLFDKLLAPVEPLLSCLDSEPISQAAKKLSFRLFVRLLLFRLFAQIISLRDLVEDLKTSPTANLLLLPVVGLSTIHDAFARYPVSWICALTQHLMQSVAMREIPEIAVLGSIWCVDSSLWPVVRQLGWLTVRGVQGVRLHLGLSLNVMCPALFVLSYDKSPTCSDRSSLIEMAQAGVTYILDRGYVHLALYLDLIDRGAFFVIRERNNLQYQVLANIDLCHHGLLGKLQDFSDSVIKLDRDPNQTLFRLIHFAIAGHEFHLLTNRWDLASWQIVMLYGWRWQVELIFRAWKHTFGALHMINLSEEGIEIQFHILLIASLLWGAFQQETSTIAAASESNEPRKQVARSKPVTRTAILSTVFRVSWRLIRPILRIVRNCLSQPLSVYINRMAELRL